MSLSESDAKAVIEAVVVGHGKRGASEEEILRAVRWAEGVVMNWTLLRLVLEGQLCISKIQPDALREPDLTFVTRGSART